MNTQAIFNQIKLLADNKHKASKCETCPIETLCGNYDFGPRDENMDTCLAMAIVGVFNECEEKYKQ